MVAAIGIGAPLALSNRKLVVAAVNRLAGISPFRFELEGIGVGWWQPLKMAGLRLIDGNGMELVRLAELETERGLWGVVTDYRNLGVISIRGASMQVKIEPGTSSLEEALKPWLSPSSTDSSPGSEVTASASLPQGRLRVEQATIMASDSVDGSAWKLTIHEADLPLPTAEQPIPPINLSGAIEQLVAAEPKAALPQGGFTVRTQPLIGSGGERSGLPPMQMTIATTDLPLEWYSLLRRRIPGLAIERLDGKATVQADVELLSKDDIRAKIATAQIDQLRVVATDLVGREGAALKQVRLSGVVKMTPDRWIAENTVLESDVGALGIAASLPTNFLLPSAAEPWIADAQWNVQGNVDLARLLRVAPGVIPLQAGTTLTQGKASLLSLQRLGDGGYPQGEHRIELGDLVGNVAGTPLTWEKALTASIDVERTAEGQAHFSIDCSAEFCEIKGEGDLQAGQLVSKVDLDRLHQRLSKWVALPLSQLAGNANLQWQWNQTAGNRLSTQGSLETTPLQIGLKAGQMNEPAWRGSFEAIGTLHQGRLLQVDRGTLTLDSEQESLRAELQEPLTWTTTAPGAEPLPPAGVTIELTGDIGAWQRRAQLIAGQDPGFLVDGRCEMKASGAIDTQHLEITAASFSAQPFGVNSQGFRMQEARVEGAFAGRFDSSDVARLQIEKLLVQAESFALTAKDSATADGAGREGKAAFRLEPKRLMSAMGTQGPDTSAATGLSIEGDLTGTANWSIRPATDLRWQMFLDGKDIRVFQTTNQSPSAAPGQLVSTRGSNTVAQSLLWEESLAKAGMQGIYDFQTGRLELPETTLQTVWMAYGGATTISSTQNKTKLTARGQMTYDAAQVVEKLKPWTGNYLAMSGQRTEPVEITWESSSSDTWAESLQAKLQLGWDGAKVVGIDIGRADIPLAIDNGRFHSKTVFPVSQGAMRWDLTSDLRQSPLTILQAPETVLEEVAITPQMCQGWLKYIAPLLADVTAVQGQLSLRIDRAALIPADAMRPTVDGELHVEDVTVGPGPLADQIMTIVQQVRALRKGNAAQGTSNSGAWLQMPAQNIQFAVDQGRVAHRNLKMKAGDVELTTEGSVGIDGQLELIASIPIQTDWIDGTPALATLAGQSIRIPIRGSLQRPAVDFQAFTAIGRQVAEAAAQGMLKNQLDKGLNKILGPLESKLAPLQQGLQQNMPQLPTLPALPGGFQIPGFGGAAPSAPPVVPTQP
jgi:hypothetical protein